MKQQIVLLASEELKQTAAMLEALKNLNEFLEKPPTDRMLRIISCFNRQNCLKNRVVCSRDW